MARSPRRRRTPEESRLALLDAGRQLAYERPVGEPLANIRLPEVAAVAGVTIGAIYHYWDHQDEYRMDLLRHLLDPTRFETWPDAAGVAEPLIDAGAALTEVLRQATRDGFEAVCDRPDQRVSMGLWAQEQPESRRLLRHLYDEIDREWSAVYEEVLAAYGREPRPPFGIADIAMTLTALADGLSVRHGLDPGRIERPLVEATPDGELDWPVFSCIALALLPTMTRPIGAEDEQGADLWAAVERLL